ncbi:hypothetical protein Tco_0749692 [Tanacetum coccineum]|uniref:Uncharacterized protein n=1 Tax=Tanacetum coccineum TaxID=301880 RepID=A0ABQ4Z052_9ASTR
MGRIQLLMQGTSLTKQERECKLYDAFDKFTHIKGESLHPHYLRFTQLINDMNIYKMKLEQFQVNTKFLNCLPPEWSKFVTEANFMGYCLSTNFDQLHAYLEQHELHANEVRIMRERNQDPLALSPQYGSIHPTPHYSTTYPSTPRAITYLSTPHPNAYSSTIQQDSCPQPQSIPQIEYTISTVNQQTHLAEFPQIDSGQAVPGTNSKKFQGEDNVVFCGWFTWRGHEYCIRKRDATWFRDKVLLVEAQGFGKVLNKEELELLADPRVPEGPPRHSMANLSSYGSDVLSKVPHSENTHNDMLNQSVARDAIF